MTVSSTTRFWQAEQEDQMSRTTTFPGFQQNHQRPELKPGPKTHCVRNVKAHRLRLQLTTSSSHLWKACIELHLSSICATMNG